ncbi:hypothetical protein ACJMK2_039237, partial [Sinanodonta woodiana]
YIGSNLGSGLSMIFTNLLMKDRMSLHRDRILLLVTGQNPSISHNHRLWTKILREDAGFKIFVVALGDLVNKDEFRLMTNQPWQDYFFYLKYSQIHEAVGNLTNNESVIVHTTSQLVHQIKINLKAANVSRLLLYLEATNHSKAFRLMKQVAQNIAHGIRKPGLTIALNEGNGTVFRSVDTAVESLKVIQAEKLLTFDTLHNPLVTKGLSQNLQIIMFLSSSAPSFNIRSVIDLKHLGCVVYAVGVGEQPSLETMQELVSFPWYLHLARA